MHSDDIFLSVVMVIEDNLGDLPKSLADITKLLPKVVSDFEIIIIDNTDNKIESTNLLKKLTNDNAFPNLQVYTLNKKVDGTIATCIGLDKALGDFVTILNPFVDDISFLPSMLEEIKNNYDIVIAYNNKKIINSFFYRFGRKIFDYTYKFLNKASIAKDVYPYRLLSRSVSNQILKDQYPEMTLRHLPSSIGYRRKELNYNYDYKVTINTNFFYSFKSAIKFLISTSTAPIRLISILSVFGAVINVLYSLYVLIIAIYKSEVAEGWITLSLQLSGMFFLISILFFIFSEYLLEVRNIKKNNFLEYINDEFGSRILLRNNKINIKEKNIHLTDEAV